jgi:hypothetical protein
MADIGNSTVYIGSPDWYIGDPESYAAELDYLDPRSAQYGINSTARFIATGAYSPDPDGDPIFYDWEILSAPAKSLSRLKVKEGHEATLEVDVVGIYSISLLVSGANGGARSPSVSFIIGQPASVAYNSGIEYDVGWIWQTLPDFWSILDKSERIKIEAIWSSFQAIAASELMDVFNVKDSITVGSLQADVFRKWQSFDLSLDISEAKVLFGADISGFDYTSDSTARLYLVNAQQRYDAKLIKADMLLVNGILPQTFDVGRPARLTNVRNGYRLDTKIAGVGKNSAGVAVFSVPPQNVEPSELPADYDLRLFVPGYLSSVIIRAGSDYYLSSGGGDGYINVTLPQDASDEFSIPTQIRVSNAEMLGVSPGDVVEVEAADLISSKRVKLYADVLAVFGDLVAVSPRSTISEHLVNAYGQDVSSLLEDDIFSVGWQARHRGSWLSAESVYQVGVGGPHAKNLSLRGIKIYRRRKVLIDDAVRTLFRLTSHVTRVIQVDGGVATSTGNVIKESPLELYENVDFYVRRTSDYGYRLQTVTLNTFYAEGYDFSLAGIMPGQTLVITTGLGVGTYSVISVEGQEVRVDPPALSEFVNAEFYIESPNAYLELNSTDLYDTLVDKLWAEYAVYDNSDRLEKTFGSAVGLSRDFWNSLNNKSTYRDAVATIIKKRVTASTVESLDDVISLSLGIPVAPFKSVIRSIDDEYRVSDTGEPEELHVVLEEVNANNERTGRLTTHEVSASGASRLGTTSGIATNPSTGTKYKVGDVIEQYASIGEGVRIIDLYTANRTFALNDIIDRHRFAVLIDVDSTPALASNTQKLTLMESLISEVKPIYTTFFVRLLKFLVDYIDIEDDIFFKIRTTLVDNPYHHRGPANIYDDSIPGTSDRDGPPILPLTTWFPRDGLLTDVDLDNGEVTVVSEIGGFVNPDTSTSDFAYEFNHTGVYPWIEIGDGVEISSLSNTKFDIIEVLGDTKIRLKTRYIEDRFELINPSSEPQRFFVYRTLSDAKLRTSVSVPINGDRLELSYLGQSSTNFGNGDVVTFKMDDGSNSGRLRILHTEHDDVTGIFTVHTYPRVRGISSGTGDVLILRELIRDRRFLGHAYPSGREGTTPYFDIYEHAFTKGLDVGDMLDVEGVVQARIAGISDNRVFLDRLVPSLERKSSFNSYRIDTNVGEDDLDEQEIAVGSAVNIVIRGLKFTFDNGVLRNRNQLLELVPGDIIILPLEVDLGEGPGVLRISAPRSSNAYFTNAFDHPLASQGTFTGAFICSLIRQDALHSDYFTPRSSNTMTWGAISRTV